MDINIRSIGSGRPVTSVPREESAPSGGPQPPAAKEEGVSVHLTDTVAAIQSGREAMSQTPAVDAERVAALKSAIASGRYVVDAGRVASKFLSLESSL